MTPVHVQIAALLPITTRVMWVAGTLTFVLLVGMFIVAARRQLVRELLSWLAELGVVAVGTVSALLVIAVVITTREVAP